MKDIFESKINYSMLDTPTTEDKFIPKGAIAFFVLLILLCLIIWFGIYFIMVGRS